MIFYTYISVAALIFLGVCLLCDEQSWKNDPGEVLFMAAAGAVMWPLVLTIYGLWKTLEFLRNKTKKYRIRFENRNKDPKVRFE